MKKLATSISLEPKRVMSDHEDWKGVVRPVTIHQLLQVAEHSPIFEDKSLVIDGRGFSAVMLVAHVVSVEKHPAKITYFLEDGTGRICADKELSSLIHYPGSHLLAEIEEEETFQSYAFEHTYVEITGIPQKGNWGSKISIKSMNPVLGYDQVMYHILNVIHCNNLIQHYIEPYSPDKSNRTMFQEIEVPMDVDKAGQEQDDIDIQHYTTLQIPSSHAILPSIFSPQKQHPYASLPPLEKVIMTHVYHNRDHHISVREMAQVIQASHGCTVFEFNLAIQELLSEAYITSPLDDGYVILTPRQ